MSAIDALGATTASTASAASGGAASGLGQLDGEAFLQLLVAQLRYQNPLSPSDPNAMLEQTAQFTQVETMQQLASAQQQLLGLSHATAASGLIGREVVARTDDGLTQGIVEAVRFTSAGALLLVDGAEVRLDDATEIRSAPG